MKDSSEILWRMYNEDCNHGRHHETLRAGVTNLIITIASAILAVVSMDKALSPSDIPLTIYLIALGIFGALFSAKHYERFRAHMSRAHEFRDALEADIPETQLSQLRDNADTRHAHDWKPA